MGQIPPIRGKCPEGTKGVGTGGAKRRMRRRVVRSEMSLRLRNPKASLGDQGKLSAKLTEGIRTLQVAERHPMAQQNGHLLIPSVTASPCHRLAAARSRRGSDSPPGCHSIPRRRFAALVTKGRLGLLQIRRCDTHPCLPLWESQGASANTQKTGTGLALCLFPNSLISQPARRWSRSLF